MSNVAEQVEIQEYALALIDPHSDKVLGMPGARGVQLPCIKIQKWTRTAEEINEAVRIRCMRKGKGISIIIPKLEMCFIICTTTNKCTLIGHNVISLMPVNIHSILCFIVAPVYLYKPLLCC